MSARRRGEAGGGGRRLWEEGKGDEEGPLDDRLPSEQDRKATLGALAAVLNIVFAARRRETITELPKSKGGSGEEASNSEENVEGAPDALAFSIRQDGDDDAAGPGGESAKARQQRERADRRARAFQRELLQVSAELLFLSPDHAAVFLPNLDVECADAGAERELLLRPFLESLSSAEDSFRCIALLLLRFLLQSGEEKPSGGEGSEGKSPGSLSALDQMTIVGYDSRVRYAFKYLAVAILAHWDMKEHKFMAEGDAVAHATRKFEALEDGIALRLARMASSMREKGGGKSALAGQKKESSFRQSAIRGLKIGAAGVAAGTVFAITGGLAAPAIVGSIAALTGAGSAVTILATVLLLPAATTIFGVGGGTLVASKMSKRTSGLSEFEIEKMTPDSDGEANNPELSRTVCVGGWLSDDYDFERPFGVTPRGLADRHELLCRYCSVYAPHIIPSCDAILEEWKGKEDELWEMLRASYGKDPNALLPLEKGPRYDSQLSSRENAAVDDVMRSMALPICIDQRPSEKSNEPATATPPTVNLLTDVLAPSEGDSAAKEMDGATLRIFNAWDFHAEFGGELYTIKWERELLLDMNRSAKEFQRDLAKKAAGEALKKTALHSLMLAAALPAVLLSLTNAIDEKWTLVAERADEAGVLLAQSLLDSKAGHRPVSLVGFSFGARMIVACLKELARNQLIWEQQQEGSGGIVEDNTKPSAAASLRKSISNVSNRRLEAISFSREPASIVDDVIIMGCPASVNTGTPGTSAAIVRARRHMPLAIADDAVGGGAHTTCTKPPDLSLDLWHPDDFHHRKSPAARFVVIAGDADVRVHQRLTNGCAQSAPAPQTSATDDL
ncbi:hypothetical protein ACHAXT_004241 [Thalassiosira profunda]